MADQPLEAARHGRFRFLGAAAVAQGVFAGGAASAVKRAGQRHAARPIAAQHSGGIAVSQGPVNRASLPLVAETSGSGKIHGRSLLGRIHDAHRLVGIGRSRHAHFRFAVGVELNIGVEFLGGGVDVRREKGVIVLFLIHGISIDDGFFLAVLKCLHGGRIAHGQALEKEIKDRDHAAIEHNTGQDSRN